MGEGTGYPLYDRLLGLYDHARNLARSLSGNSYDADVVVQESFMNLWKARERLTDRNLQSCLMTTVRNTYFTMCRRKKTHRKTESGVALSDDILRMIPEVTPYELPLELSDALERCVDSLPETCQTILQDSLANLSYDEICAKRNIPAGTVASRMSRAKGKMREHLRSKVPQLVPEAANVA